MRYLVNLVYDSDYRGYAVDVPALPGCMSQGKTVDEALENVREAIALYRETVGDQIADFPEVVISAQIEV